MKYIIIPLTIVFMALSIIPVKAQERRSQRHRDLPDSIVGTIKDVRRDMFTIYDESEKEDKSFVYVLANDALVPGNRVRIFFNTSTGSVTLIKKMTHLEFNKAGQNLGYIYNAK